MNRARGSVLVETLVAILPFWISVGLSLELGRRVVEEFALFHVAFLRARALGFEGRPVSVAAERRFAERAFGASGEVWWKGVDLRVENADGGFSVGAHRRFAQLLSFPGKHHEEITRRCFFARSSR